MKILIPEQPTTAASPTGPVLVRRYQIVVPVQLVIDGTISPTFPAILDTGHSHNLSLTQEHLRQWVRVSVQAVGTIKVNQQIIPLVKADLLIDGKILALPDGIAVFPSRSAYAPRLPLLGLRVLVRHRVRVVIDGMNVDIG